MRKIAIGISLVLNVLLLIGLFYAFTSQSKTEDCPKCDTDKSVVSKKVVTCSKKIPVDSNMTSIESISDKIILEHDVDGVLTSMKTGIVIKYTSDEVYQNALKSDIVEKREDLGDKTIFQYTDSDVKYKTEDGKEEDIWFKSLVKTFTSEGYQCE